MKTLNIVLISMVLNNFKGIRHREINFKDSENFISGDNATGKTTIADAFSWVRSDKDSLGREKFNIKTLDKNGFPIHNLDHEVIAELLVNGEKITLRKVLKEKWTKPRGQIMPVFDGHTTTCYYNDIPLAQKDYNAKVEAICPEKAFKLLTNPLCFPLLNWTEQRQILIEVAGNVSDNDIASLDPAFQALLDRITNNKTIDELKREIASKKKRIKDDLDQIPSRIDEVHRGLPESFVWGDLEKEITACSEKIKSIENQIMDAGKGLEAENAKRIEVQRSINEKKNLKSRLEQEKTSHIDNIRYEYDRKLRGHNQQIKDYEETIRIKENTIRSKNISLESLRSRRENLIAEWKKINAETLTFTAETICPTCGQELPEDFLAGKRSEAEAKFNSGKSSRLEANVADGKRLKAEIEEAAGQINQSQAAITEAKNKIEELKGSIPAEPDYKTEGEKYLESKGFSALVKDIETLEKALQDLGPAKIADTSVLQAEKKELQAIIDGKKMDLSRREQIAAGEKRIDELTSQQQRLAQEIADFEKDEFLIAEFTKAKIEAVEKRINGLFRIVKFKMFNTQVNGVIAETCECTVEGVPYSDLNSAMRINAGLDILSTLSDKYGITAPIFVDNRETINNLLSVKSQIINLVVTRDKELVFN
jgi:exonuclease SbcC